MELHTTMGGSVHMTSHSELALVLGSAELEKLKWIRMDFNTS